MEKIKNIIFETGYSIKRDIQELRETIKDKKNLSDKIKK